MNGSNTADKHPRNIANNKLLDITFKINSNDKINNISILFIYISYFKLI